MSDRVNVITIYIYISLCALGAFSHPKQEMEIRLGHTVT